MSTPGLGAGGKLGRRFGPVFNHECRRQRLSRGQVAAAGNRTCGEAVDFHQHFAGFVLDDEVVDHRGFVGLDRPAMRPNRFVAEPSVQNHAFHPNRKEQLLVVDGRIERKTEARVQHGVEGGGVKPEPRRVDPFRPHERMRLVPAAPDFSHTLERRAVGIAALCNLSVELAAGQRRHAGRLGGFALFRVRRERADNAARAQHPIHVAAARTAVYRDAAADRLVGGLHELIALVRQDHGFENFDILELDGRFAEDLLGGGEHDFHVAGAGKDDAAVDRVIDQPFVFVQRKFAVPQRRRPEDAVAQQRVRARRVQCGARFLGFNPVGFLLPRIRRQIDATDLRAVQAFPPRLDAVDVERGEARHKHPGRGFFALQRRHHGRRLPPFGQRR